MGHHASFYCKGNAFLIVKQGEVKMVQWFKAVSLDSIS